MQLETVQQLFDAQLVCVLPSEPVVSLEDGWLCLRLYDRTVKLRLWPQPDAFIVAPSGRRGIDNLKCIDEMPLSPVSSLNEQIDRFFGTLAQQTLDIDPEWRDERPDLALLSVEEKSARVQALCRLITSIPDDLRVSLDVIPSHKLMILHCCSHSRYFKELFISNPQLAFILSVRFGKSNDLPERAGLMDGLSRLKQRDLVGLVGLPTRQSSVHLIRKFTPAALDIYDPELIGWMLADPLFGYSLPHLPYVGSGLLKLMKTIANTRGIRVGRELVRQAACNDHDCKLSADLITELSMLAQTPEPGDNDIYLNNLHSLARKYVAVKSLFEIELARKDTRRFPTPPIHGNADIIPLTCPAELVREGEDQGNCVASYLTDILNGVVFVYKMIRPERATIEVFCYEEGWELGEIAGPENSEVGAAGVEAAQKWFEKYS